MNVTSSKEWRAAVGIISDLRKAGHEALLAGGCVRDMLLGILPKDYDIATNATPQAVSLLFPGSRTVGAQFGVVLVRRFGCSVEIATYRADGPYSDGRRPDSVRFGSRMEDARRRDFTVNGLYQDPETHEVFDDVGGTDDLHRRVIRTIGDPHARFQEDHLRLIRAVRFAARLDFTMEPATMRAITQLAPQLRTVSAERIWMELERILAPSTRMNGWRLLCETGLRGWLSPSWPADAARDELAGLRLSHFPNLAVSATLGLAACLADLDDQTVRRVCRELRLSNHAAGCTQWLCAQIHRSLGVDAMELADVKELMAGSAYLDLLHLIKADLKARAAPMQEFDDFLRRAAQIAPEDVCPRPLATGDDLNKMGAVSGPWMGKTLQRLYRLQLNELLRSRDDALEEARRIIDDEAGQL